MQTQRPARDGAEGPDRHAHTSRRLGCSPLFQPVVLRWLSRRVPVCPGVSRRRERAHAVMGPRTLPWRDCRARKSPPRQEDPDCESTFGSGVQLVPRGGLGSPVGAWRLSEIRVSVAWAAGMARRGPQGVLGDLEPEGLLPSRRPGSPSSPSLTRGLRVLGGGRYSVAWDPCPRDPQGPCLERPSGPGATGLEGHSVRAGWAGSPEGRRGQAGGPELGRELEA